MEQLIKRNCETGAYEEIHPVTSISAIIDLSTGKTLDSILQDTNHIYLPFKDNSRGNTRLQVPNKLRRKGLWITYQSCRGNIITEWYNSDDYSNSAWRDNKNWISYLDKDMVERLLNEVLAWYKA